MKRIITLVVLAALFVTATTVASAEPPDMFGQDDLKYFLPTASDNPTRMVREAFVSWHRDKLGELRAIVMFVVSEPDNRGTLRITRARVMPIDADLSFDFAAYAEEFDSRITVWTRAGRTPVLEE